MLQEEKSLHKCAKCNNFINDIPIQYKGRSFHENCFEKFFKKIRFEAKIFGFSFCI